MVLVPPSLSESQAYLVNAIYSHWASKRTWPKLGRLRAQVKREAKVSLADLLVNLPDWTVKMPPTNQDDDPVMLAIRGISFAGRNDVIKAFLALHRKGASLFIKCPNEDPKISSEHLRELLPDLSAEDFEAVSALVLDNYDGSSWGPEKPSGWWRQVGEGGIRYETVSHLEEWIELRNDLGTEVDELQPRHVAILAELYDSFRKTNSWPDYLEFLVANRSLGNIIRTMREFPPSHFWSRRATGDSSSNRTELRLTFRGALASGLASEDLEPVAKAIHLLHQHYAGPDGDKLIPLEGIVEKVQLPVAHLPRFRFLLNEAHVGVELRELPDGWSAKVTSWIEEFENVATAGDLLSKWFPNADWKTEVLKSPSAGKQAEQTSQRPREGALAGYRLKSVPVELVELVGTGGSADVYRAKVLKQIDGLPGEIEEVAVKITQDWLLAPKRIKETRLRVDREGSLKGKNHPHLVRSYGSFSEMLQGRDCPFVVLEYIKGITLKQWIATYGSATLRQFTLFMLAIIDALEFLHKESIVHRDIKPSNVMIEQTKEMIRVVLMDLGIAHFEDEADVTTTVHCFGTKRCAAPEFLLRKPPEAANNPAVDVYSLGTVAYDLITGTEFLGHLKNEAQVALEVVNWIPVITTNAFPKELVSLTLRMLAKKAEDRPALSDVKALLLRINKGDLGTATSVPEEKSEEALQATSGLKVDALEVLFQAILTRAGIEPSALKGKVNACNDMNGHSFTIGQSRRLAFADPEHTARMEGAIGDLLVAGMLEIESSDSLGTWYRVTREGYQQAKDLKWRSRTFWWVDLIPKK